IDSGQTYLKNKTSTNFPLSALRSHGPGAGPQRPPSHCRVRVTSRRGGREAASLSETGPASPLPGPASLALGASGDGACARRGRAPSGGASLKVGPARLGRAPSGGWTTVLLLLLLILLYLQCK
uniref:Uncharacterized protein n=1 Tax=Gopherus agassizii TaxID=38772 RepID=A0A452H5F1_9SAUR